MHPSGPLFLLGSIGVQGTVPNGSFISLSYVVKSTSTIKKLRHMHINAQSWWYKVCKQNCQLQHIIHYNGTLELLRDCAILLV